MAKSLEDLGDEVPGKVLTIDERFGDLDIFKEPQQMIYTDENNTLVIKEAVISQFQTIKAPLNIVAVCGRYRTGKSFLLNQLAQKTSGFVLGSTTEGQTKGIWVWCRAHPLEANQVLVLLDTEGQADIDKENYDQDNKLFCLATMLSSTLVYNNAGVFERNDLDKLSFIAKMSETILFKDETGSEKADEKMIRFVTPSFILCLRDIFLDITINKKKVSAGEYLESILSNKSGKNELNDKTRECITNYFYERSCFALHFPAEIKKLKNLQTVGHDELDKDYIQGLNTLQTYVYRRKPKYLTRNDKVPIDGPAFEILTKSYAKSLADGKTLSFASAFEQVANQHHGRLCDKLVGEFKQETNQWNLLEIKTKEELQRKCIDLMAKTLEKFRNNSMTSTSHFEDQAQVDMLKLITDKQTEYKTRIQESFLKTLQSLHSQLDKKKYETKDGVILYYEDIEEIVKTFRSGIEGYDEDGIQFAVIEFKKNINDERLKIKFDAKMKEEMAKFDKARAEIEAKLKKDICRLCEELEKVKEEYMIKEKERFESMCTETFALNYIKNQTFFARLKLLFFP